MTGYIILVYGERLAAYGPFKTETEARNHADAYLQNYRIEIMPCIKVPELVNR